MMNLETSLFNKVQELVPECKIETIKALKTNAEVTSYVFKTGEDGAFPTFREDDLLSRIENEGLDKVAESIVSAIRKSRPVDVYGITSPEYILENVVFRVLNRERNLRMMEEYAYVECLDMLIVFEVNVRIGDDFGGYLLCKEAFKRLDMSVEELFERAKHNMAPFMQGLLHGHCGERPVSAVISASYGQYGAAELFNLNLLAEEIGCEAFVVIPFSINDVYAVPIYDGVVDDIEKEVLKRFSKDVGEDCPAEIFLTDSLYLFKDGELSFYE